MARSSAKYRESRIGEEISPHFYLLERTSYLEQINVTT